MIGIRRKLNTGFLCLAAMLLFSGMVSFFELNRMGRRARAILETSSLNIDVSKRMLDAVQTQNSSLLQMVVLHETQYDSAWVAARDMFDEAMDRAAATGGDRAELDSISAAAGRYYSLVTNYFDDRYNTDINWFMGMYKTSYTGLTGAIKEYMTTSQRYLLERAEELEDNAYRTIMPGIITLSVAILMILVFMYLVDLYYTRPLMRMNRSLQDHIRLGLPFRVSMEGRDEIFRLREQIESLIAAVKSKKSE